MQKILMLFSFAFCLLFVSSVYSQSDVYAEQCIGCCENPYEGQCTKPWWDGRFYAGAFGATNWLNVHREHLVKPKFELGYVGALSLGYKLNSGYRIEGEVAYRRNDFKHKEVLSGDSYENFKMHGNTSSWSLMVNFLHDLDGVSCYLPNVVPYVGLGLGYTHIHAHLKAQGDNQDIRCKGSSNGLAVQVIAGVGYQLTHSTTLGVEYRYFVGREHARDHSVGLALRQAF